MCHLFIRLLDTLSLNQMQPHSIRAYKFAGRPVEQEQLNEIRRVLIRYASLSPSDDNISSDHVGRLKFAAGYGVFPPFFN